MKVQATELGYYQNQRKKPGDVFVLQPIKTKIADDKGKMVEKVVSAADQFSERWMKKVDGTEKRVHPPQRRTPAATSAPNLKKPVDAEQGEVEPEVEHNEGIENADDYENEQEPPANRKKATGDSDVI